MNFTETQVASMIGCAAFSQIEEAKQHSFISHCLGALTNYANSNTINRMFVVATKTIKVLAAEEPA